MHTAMNRAASKFQIQGMLRTLAGCTWVDSKLNTDIPEKHSIKYISRADYM
jgi:hypothetical protein